MALEHKCIDNLHTDTVFHYVCLMNKIKWSWQLLQLVYGNQNIFLMGRQASVVCNGFVINMAAALFSIVLTVWVFASWISPVPICRDHKRACLYRYGKGPPQATDGTGGGFQPFRNFHVLSFKEGTGRLWIFALLWKFDGVKIYLLRAAVHLMPV